MKTIAFLGIGAMGDRIAHNLLKVGYDLRIWNRSPQKCQNLVEKGAISYSSPQEAVKGADVAIAMVTNDEASRFIWLDEVNGAIHNLKPDTVAMEYSTLTPDWCRELATQVKHKGGNFLDAPVVGTRPQAEKRQLIHLIGGEETVVAQVRELLKASSKAIYQVGTVGSGMTMKLAVNALFGTQVAALSEILGLLRSAGIETKSAVKLLNEMPITSSSLRVISSLITGQNYAPLFPIDLVEKDFSYVEQLANSVNASIPAMNRIREIYQQGKKAGYGGDNITGIAQLF